MRGYSARHVRRAQVHAGAHGRTASAPPHTRPPPPPPPSPPPPPPPSPPPPSNRTKKATAIVFALNAVRFCGSLPQVPEASVIGRQLIRSATSVGANYRAVCRAKSRADFIAKLSIVEEEADESAYWIELIIESGFQNNELVRSALKEANELTAILHLQDILHETGKINNLFRAV